MSDSNPPSKASSPSPMHARSTDRTTSSGQMKPAKTKDKTPQNTDVQKKKIDTKTDAILTPITIRDSGTPQNRIKPLRFKKDRTQKSHQTKSKLQVGSKAKNPLKIGLMALALSGVWSGSFILCLSSIWSQDLPSVETLWTPNRPVSQQIVDRTGRHIAVRGAEASAPVDVETLPYFVKQAVLSTEDRRFYKHVGIDPLGLIRAAYVNIRAGRVIQGGSTLTQQLTKNVFLSPEKTLKRKGQEMLLSLWLEHNFTKSEILNLYVNRVYFGNGTWGLRAASENYFGKAPETLSLSESALLAGLLKAPSRYNPLAHPERAALRSARVLAGMAEHGVINRREEYEALLAPIKIKRRISEDSTNYFVDWIWEEVEKQTGGLQADIVVQTTLDHAAQIAAHMALTKHLDPEKNANQGAVLTLDGTGAVRVMVGGRSYPESQFNRVTQAKRQSGSAFKPFVYLTAFENGYTPWDQTEDVPIQIDDWAPQNFDKQFRGPVSIQDAFRWSINSVAVTLQERIGRQTVINTAKKMGLDTLSPLPSLALGAQVTTPLALTQAYLPFANWGQTATPYGVLSISTAEGQVLYNRESEWSDRVLNTDSLGHMNTVFKRSVEMGTGQNARIKGREVGGKTGTTNDFKDAWFIGFVPDLVTAVWVGSDDNRPMKRVTGGSIPARIFKDTMIVALKGHSFAPLPVSQPPILNAVPQNRRPKTLNSLLNDIEDSLP